MHVAYVCADRGVPIGGTKGASVHVRGIAQALARRGHRVTILGSSVTEEIAGRRLSTIDFGFDRALKDLKAGVEKHGTKALAREVHSLLLNTCLAERLAAVDAKLPIDVVYERYSLFSFSALRFARSRRLAFGLEVNAPLVEEQQTYRSLSLRPAAEAVEMMVVQQADVVFVPSQPLRDWVEGPCQRRRRTHVVPNGVDLRLFARASLRPVDTIEEPSGRFVLAFVGSLKPWHGIEQLTESFVAVRKLIPSAHLLVVGDGPLRHVVEETAERVGRQHVTLVGSVPHEEVPQWLSRADVALAPYPALDDFYFSPLKIVEYQAAALPVIASRIGHIERQIDDGETGLLVKPGDVGELTRGVVRLFEDPGLRESLGENARRRVFATAGWDRAAKRVTRALEHASRRQQGRKPLREAR